MVYFTIPLLINCCHLFFSPTVKRILYVAPCANKCVCVSQVCTLSGGITMLTSACKLQG